ncbi:hypothetical protein GHK68_24355 [Sinorhizobium meliloti]|nr:hypothetical protein [Sinorhizobium meliloti]MQW45306.1 hypothetical protein [Sinorhizobium meliloti]
MADKSPALNFVLLVLLFFVLIFCGPIILQGWRDLTGTVKAAAEFQP